MKFLAILVSIIACASVQVPYDMDISWTVDGDSAKFTFSIGRETYDGFGWTGMGIKNTEDGPQMKNGDYVSVVLATGETIDRHGVRNGSPKPDEEQGGEQSLSEIENLGFIGNDATYTWTRKLDTGDINDTILEVGKEYYLQWAVGEYEAGVIKHHKESGYLTIIFTEDSVQPVSFLSIA